MASTKLSSRLSELKSLSGSDKFLLRPIQDIYVGDYTCISGKLLRNGNGTYTTHNRQIYQGEWKDDKLISGCIIYPDSCIYEGSFQDLEYNGFFKITFPDGTYMNGNFNRNDPINQVTYVCNEHKFEGKFSKSGTILSPVSSFFDDIPMNLGLQE